MAKEAFHENDENKELSEEQIEESYALAESDTVVDREDYDPDEIEQDRWKEDLAKNIVDTQHDDGHTYNPDEAWEQGLTYTPPTDPPTIPGGGRQGAEVGAGFAPSMEETNPGVEKLPPHLDNSDLDLQDDVYEALRLNSETGDLVDRVTVSVREGVVTLAGTVKTDDDIAIAYDIITGLDGVVEVNSLLEVES